MPPISIQNSLQNQYLGVEDQDTSLLPVKETSDEDRAVSTNPVPQVDNDETVMQQLSNPHAQIQTEKSQEQSDNTILQYSDSALHNPADQTVYQKIAPSTEEASDQTVYQVDAPLNAPQTQRSQATALVQNAHGQVPSLNPGNLAQDTLRGSGSVTSRLSSLTGTLLYSARQMFDPAQWKSRLRSKQPLLAEKNHRKVPNNQPLTNTSSTEAQISLEQHQKTLRELDDCRLAYAKELARNGKFRDAIAMARKITPTSRCFKDVQTLIRTWKQF